MAGAMPSYQSLTQQREKISCIVVGDKGVGKDTILEKYAERMEKKMGIDDEKVEAINGIYSFPFPFKGVNKELCLLSISGEEQHRKRRKLCYWDAGVFLVCFSVVDENSRENVKKTWVPEIKEFCKQEKQGNVPILLLGTQTNRRDDDGEPGIDETEGRAMKDELRVTDYVECGADEESVTDVFADVCTAYQRSRTTRW